MSYQADDLKYGEEMENEVLNKLNLFFNLNMKKEIGKYSIFDFADKEKKVKMELKSRKNMNFRTYDSLMVGYNKIRKARLKMKYDPDYKFYIVWKLDDGLFFYEVEKDFDVKCVRVSGRSDRGCIERSQYAHIPLIKIKKIYL